ncbi:hypothetical protein [Deinococcus sp. Leaf326]|uniref:hypothetical protein n=1 Tax=Deinococcus sp. Leaf326 TaxID=1736338 RepID=UPI0006F762FA|nr:hypothetical protein [Deinococcus sp. Leaf326]KQR37715.1 hypothetical protein ASF71_14640 [Deinococcus sp. Leaf326]
MKRHPALLLLGVALLIPAAAVVVATSPPGCRLQVIPDYTWAVTYKAVLRLSPGCTDGTVLRVRKSSTQNVRRDGAPYQPIKPAQGAWNFGKTSTVPKNELWTVYTWRWEWWDAQAWNPRTQALGRWTAAEVLNATP